MVTARGFKVAALMILQATAIVKPGFAGEIIVPVQLRDYAELQPTVLQTTKNQIAAIIGRAGISVLWVEQNAASLDEGLVVVNILSRPPSQQEHLRMDTMGFTPVTRNAGHFINVIVSRVKERADMHDVSIGMLLGAAIAHEIGHLLMPYVPHSVRGIMRASWNLVDYQLATRGTLMFLPSEVEKLQASAARRSHDAAPAHSR